MPADLAIADHLDRPRGRGHMPAHAHTGAAGGAACGDLIRLSLAIDPADPSGRIADAGFDASGCAAAIAAGSAAVELMRGAPLLEAARVSAATIAAELGGLIPAKRHAAELAADALHRALGAAARAQANLAPVPERQLVAMSGGVDSAVVALLARERSPDVVAVTLELWADPMNDGERSCCSAQAVRGARALAHDLGLPHLSIDLRAEFRAGVVDPWLADHAAGLTPNPCVRCNGFVRLDAMLELARRLGASTLATGHYARVRHHPPGEPAREGARAGGENAAGEHGPLLRVAADPAKDQSYALAALSPSSLERLRFPLGELTKPQVRALARRAGLAVARRADSQDLCFLAGTSQTDFLARHGEIHSRPGPVRDAAGERLGEHRGVRSVTVGQRRGLGVSGREPLYVLATDPAANTVTVGPRERLLSGGVAVRDVVMRRPAASVDAVKLRYRGRRLPCRVREPLPAGEHPAASIELARPAERTAPGQVACLYAGELVVGHAIVCPPRPGP
ncbi:MAG TPA: tRNA 2-thiouridine(34) synthase MnmA [Solirubrobacteraceae bacterium]|nr:tRNA 2-thiouridine(34) synthase MnmA [Solirubrobacteraceae bacterium]